MEISEAKGKRAKVQKDIVALLKDFEDETGLMVAGVDYFRSDDIRESDNGMSIMVPIYMGS